VYKAMRGQLDKLSGREFDLAYIRGQVADHQKTVQLLERKIGSGQDRQLKAFVPEVLPAMLRHLQMASTNSPGAAPMPAGRPRHVDFYGDGASGSGAR
jgi:predicted outer membrane protein